MPSAFQIPKTLPLPDVPDVDRVLEAIIQFVNTQNWDESHHMLAERPELLAPEADMVLALLVDVASQEADTEAVYYLTLHRDLLALCRKVGVDNAYRQLLGGSSPIARHASLDVLDAVAHNTVAVLTALPEQLEEWQASVREIEKQAKTGSDDQMLELLKGIQALLDGAMPDAVTPSVSGAYRGCWDQIARDLAAVPGSVGYADMFTVMARNALAALDGSPAVREEWQRYFRNLHRAAEDLSDGPLAALSEAIATLLEDGLTTRPAPALEGPYRACWQRIITSLDGADRSS